jgi:hypothetical protein
MQENYLSYLATYHNAPDQNVLLVLPLALLFRYVYFINKNVNQ